MLGLMHVVDVNPEERVGQPPWLRRVRKVHVNDESGEGRQEDAPAPFAARDERVVRVDDAVPSWSK